MFDNSRYSLARYSLSTDKNTVEIAESFTEHVNAVAGAAIPVDTKENFLATLRAVTRGTVSIPTRLTAQEGLAAAVRGVADVVTAASLVEAVGATVTAYKNIPAGMEEKAVLLVHVWLSKDIPTMETAADALITAATGSKDKYFSAVLSEVLTAVTEATSKTTETALFQLSIPPGGELRIDSEHFTATLNGENILYAQSGAWINISPELLRLGVESATGDRLEGTVLFTERFL